MRTLARENMFRLAFSFEFTKEVDEQALQEFCQEDGTDKSDAEYLKEFYSVYVKNYNEIWAKLKDNLIEKNIDRIYKSDIVVILCTICEIDFVKTPSKVAINEAVNIAKKFGTEQSGKFVNGILGTIYKE